MQQTGNRQGGTTLFLEQLRLGLVEQAVKELLNPKLVTAKSRTVRPDRVAETPKVMPKKA